MHLTRVGFSWVGLAQGLACSKYSMNANFWWIKSICTMGEKYDGSFFIAPLFYSDWFFESKNCSVMYGFLQPHELYSLWNYPGQNTGVGSLSLFQGIFPIQGLNPGLLHCRQILYCLNHQRPTGFHFILYSQGAILAKRITEEQLQKGSGAWKEA